MYLESLFCTQVKTVKWFESFDKFLKPRVEIKQDKKEKLRLTNKIRINLSVTQSRGTKVMKQQNRLRRSSQWLIGGPRCL